MEFNCSTDRLKWSGEIKRYTAYEGSHYYMYVSARDSGLDVYFGRAQMAQWIVSVPDLKASAIISSLRHNVAYNAEKIGAAVGNEIDGESIAQALCAFAKGMQIEELDGKAALMESLKAAGYEIEENKK